MVRIFGRAVRGPSGRSVLALLSAVMVLTFIAVMPAQAVHETGILQLDGDAQSSLQSTPNAREDWDQICSALLTTLTPAGTCEKNPAYNLPIYGTLAAGINASTTTITVNEGGTGSITPPAVPFIIRIESEEMRVTARTGASNPRTYTVVRGYNSAVGSSPQAGPAAPHTVANGTVFASTIGSPVSFVVDPSQSATDDILKGGTKDDNPVGSWKWASSKPSPAKNDITHAFAAEYTCNDQSATPAANNVANCPVAGPAIRHQGHKILFFGGDRVSNNGSANLAFWFFQQPVHQLLADGVTPVGTAGVDVCTDSSGCSFSGEHVAGTFNPDGSINTPGDILIISAFGPHAQLQVYMWVGKGNAPSPCFTQACSLVPLIPITAGAECGSSTADDACAMVNAGGEPSPWTLVQKNAPDNKFASTNFFEGGIDLNNLGLGGACFSSFLMNTRASAAGDAELHDKVIGTFQRCAPALSTTASENGNTVQPGTPVHDTATVAVSGASSPADPTGTVNFFLCGPNANADPACTSNGTAIGSGTLNGGANANDGFATADSPNVNCTSDAVSGCFVGGSVNPLANGHYCFRATWAGDSTYGTFNPPITNPDNTDECFQVLQLGTTLVTDPQQPAGTTVSTVTLNTNVVDHAIVSGPAGGGSPTGTVDFYVCNPGAVTGTGSSAHCAGTGSTGDGILVNSVTPLTSGPGADQSEATSSAVKMDTLGVWCFRATYTPDNAVFTGSSGDDNAECVTVTTSASATSAQKYLPNDSVTITSAAGNIPGTLSIVLVKGTLSSCSTTPAAADIKYTEPVPSSGAFTATEAGATYDTTNGSVAATTFEVKTGNQGDYYWRIVFDPTSQFAGNNVVKCEKSSVSIDNNP